MKKTVIFAAVLCLLCSCSSFYFLSAKKARTTGNVFMDSVFSKKDFAQALSVSAPQVQHSELEKMAAEVTKKYGRVEAYKAEYYVPESGSRSVTIMYSAITEGAIVYVKLTVMFNDSGNYVVTGASWSDLAPEIPRTARNF